MTSPGRPGDAQPFSQKRHRCEVLHSARRHSRAGSRAEARRFLEVKAAEADASSRRVRARSPSGTSQQNCSPMRRFLWRSRTERSRLRTWACPLFGERRFQRAARRLNGPNTSSLWLPHRRKTGNGRLARSPHWPAPSRRVTPPDGEKVQRDADRWLFRFRKTLPRRADLRGLDCNSSATTRHANAVPYSGATLRRL